MRQYQGLVFACQHGTIARREYVSLTGASERTATRDLGALVGSGLLEVVGGKGWRTTYRVVGERAS
jgi:Fic family protein